MELGLKGKVALVTGGGRGIGARTALYLAAEGARLVVVDLEETSAAESAAAVAAAGGEAIGLSCDVTSEESVAQVFAEISERFGSLDIVVNNAGIVRDKSLLKMTKGDWDAVLDVTLNGAFYCCRAAIPGMRERRWGRIINISSRSVFGNPGQTNYSAAKAGVIGFTRSLSLEQASYGITVNAIAPGFIETDAIRALPHYPQLKEAATAKTPVGFLGSPEDVASAVAFLASDRARYMTGTTMFVTGGRFSS